MSVRSGDNVIPLLPLIQDADSDFIMSEDEEEDLHPIQRVIDRMKFRPQEVNYSAYWPSIIISGTMCLLLGFLISYISIVMNSSDNIKFVNNDDENNLINLISENQINLSKEKIEKSENYIFTILKPYNFLFNNYTVITSNKTDRKTSKVSLLFEKTLVEHLWTELNISNTYMPKNLNIMGHVVYVNYGLLEDWQKISLNSTTASDKIIIARLGVLNVENIANTVNKLGAKALIVYSEVDDYKIWYSTGVSVSTNLDGNYYFDETFYKLPVFSIPRHKAENILTIMLRSNDASWQSNVPGFSKKGILNIKTFVENMNINYSDIIVTIKGDIDEYVVIGAFKKSHNDITALLEMIRIFNLRKSSGWKPYRSILFVIWDSEDSIGPKIWSNNHKFADVISYIDLTTSTDNSIEYTPLLKKIISKCMSKNIFELNITLPGYRNRCFPFINTLSTSCLSIKYSEDLVLDVIKSVSKIILYLSTSTLLPFDAMDLAETVEFSLLNIQSIHKNTLIAMNWSLSEYNTSIQTFKNNLIKFQHKIEISNKDKIFDTNKKLKKLSGLFNVPFEFSNRDLLSCPSDFLINNTPAFSTLNDNLYLLYNYQYINLIFSKIIVALRSLTYFI